MTTKKNRRVILALAFVLFSSALYLLREQDHVAAASPRADRGLDGSALRLRRTLTLTEASHVLAGATTALPHFPENLTDREAREFATHLNEALSSVRGVLDQFPDGFIDQEAHALAAKLQQALASVGVGRVLDETRQGYNDEAEDKVAAICGRNSDIINTLPTTTAASVDFALQDLFHKAATTPEYQPYHSCPPFDKARPTLIVGLGKGDPWKKTSDKSWKEFQIHSADRPYGRTGNQLQGFLRALQYARDHDVQLGLLYNAYMLDDVTSMFMVRPNGAGEEDWVARLERTFCLKLFFAPEDLEGVRRYTLSRHRHPEKFETNHKVGKALFRYRTAAPDAEEQVARHVNALKLLYRRYNTGRGVNAYGSRVRDMCSGVMALLAGERSGHATYSAVHHRSLEAGGPKLLRRVANATGCDPRAALDMTPDYIKSILAPLGMLHHPIVVLTDGENKPGLRRLREDPEIGPRVRLVPEHACWVGGDVTLGVVANVFIGNPASTLSGFIARSRAVFGYGHTYMYRARDESGQWITTCRDDCLFGVSVPREDEPTSIGTDVL